MPARIGVVGTGWWATRAHLPALEHHPDAIIAAIADPDEANRRQVVERFGVPPDRAYADVTSMLKGTTLDGAIVAVPHVLHGPVTRILLEHGLPVLLEKPMTIDPADARALALLARERGVELIVGYPWQYNAHVRSLRGAIAGGRIGEVEVVACLYAAIARDIFRNDRIPDGPGEERPFIDPQRGTYSDPRIAGGGQGQSQTTHLAALLVSLVGRRPVEVTAVIDRRELGVDLIDAVIVRFEGGTLATIASTGSLIPGADEHLELRAYGTDGLVRLDVSRGEASIQVRGGAAEALEPLPDADRTPEWAPAHDLVNVVLGRGTSASPATLGVAAVELVDAMYRSAATRQPVRIDQIE
jgi:predicted dehydrogenase